MSAVEASPDMALFADQLEAPACEHPQHAERPVHADGDEHYIRFHTDCGHIGPQIKVICGAWLRWLRHKNRTVCSQCGGEWTFAESVTDLGPVSDFLN